MKKIISFSFFLLISGLIHAQNLVPNPSFEDTVACPNSSGQVSKLTDWFAAEKTPDYFNACCSQQVASVPNNLWTYRNAFDGNAYCGFIPFGTSDTTYTEKIGVQLTSPLSIGTKYYVSFMISAVCSHGNGSNIAVNKIGALFSTYHYSVSDPPPTHNFSQFSENSVITDTTNWVNVNGSFVADSAYYYLYLGKFYQFYQCDTSIFYHIVPGNDGGRSYYFIDDICVTSDSGNCLSQSSVTTIKNGRDEFKIIPNPASNSIFISTPEIEIKSIAFYDCLGVMKKKEFLPNGSFERTEDVEDLPNGIYILKIFSNKRNYSKKIIVNH